MLPHNTTKSYGDPVLKAVLVNFVLLPNIKQVVLILGLLGVDWISNMCLMYRIFYTLQCLLDPANLERVIDSKLSINCHFHNRK